MQRIECGRYRLARIGRRWVRRLVRKPVAVLAAAIVFAGPAPAQPVSGGEPAAIVTGLHGTATLVRNGRERAIELLDTLARPDRVRLGQGAGLELAATDGGARLIRISGPGNFLLRRDAAGAIEVLAQDARATVQHEDLAAQWRAVRIPPGLVGRATAALRGAPGGPLELLSPVGLQLGDAVRVLQWREPYGRRAAGCTYTVRVIDAGGVQRYSAQTPETRLDLPASLSWERDTPYLWTVEAGGSGERAPRAAAEFRIADLRTEERIRELRERLDKTHSEAEEVLFALLLEQEGLRNAAARQWQALGRPATSGLPDPQAAAPASAIQRP